ncbi:MAG: hypothetical protein E6Q40_06360 [Cupriavidus sp.]|nr:MAG: hypothetical protein E6Q40_06360 [Cupriavidus sp.]
MKSGRDIGEEHFATLEAYVKSGAAIPIGRDGAVNVTKLGELAGVPRSSFYQNTAVQGLVEELRKTNPAAPQPGAESSAKAAAGEASMTTRNADDKKSQRLEKRVQLLEQQNAALVAENYELRR